MVHGTFSPARPWRPTAGAGLARTLGPAIQTLVSRPMPHLQAASGERPNPATVGATSDEQGRRAARSLASTAKLKPRPRVGGALQAELQDSCLRPPAPPLGRDLALLWPCHPLLAVEGPRQKSCSGFHQLTANEPEIPRSGHRTASEPPLLRTTQVKSGAAKHRRLAPARPNPSLNRSSNGRPPSPGCRYTVHFRQPGLGVLPRQPG